MKNYFRILINLFRLINKKAFSGCKLFGPFIQSFSKHTELLFMKNSKITLGKNVQSDGFCRIIAGENSVLKIGGHTYFNNGCVVSAMKSITIGDNCLFGPNVMVFDNNHMFSKDNGVSYRHSCDEVKIGNNCWIAAGVIILKGTSIGDNCVIGAGCKVSGDIPSGSIVTSYTNNHIHQIEDR